MFSIYSDEDLVYSDTFPKFERKVTSPAFKMEVDAAGSLDFTVHKENICYDKILKVRSKIEVRRFDKPIWRGRVIEENIDFDNNRKLHCEGSYAFLNDSCQPLKEYSNVTFESLISSILGYHNSLYTEPRDDYRRIYFGGQTVTNEGIEYFQTSYDCTIDTIKKILERYECHCIIKVEQDDNNEWVNKIYFFKEYINFSGQVIQFGKNLLDFTRKYNLGEIATRLLPLSKTDRESSDDPVAIGTRIDTTTILDYTPERGWGVMFPSTRGYSVDVEGLQNRYSQNHLVNQTITWYGKHDPVSQSQRKATTDPLLHYSNGTVSSYAGHDSYLVNPTINLRRYLNDDNEYRYEPWYFVGVGYYGEAVSGTKPDYVKLYPGITYEGIHRNGRYFKWFNTDATETNGNFFCWAFDKDLDKDALYHNAKRYNMKSCMAIPVDDFIFATPYTYGIKNYGGEYIPDKYDDLNCIKSMLVSLNPKPIVRDVSGGYLTVLEFNINDTSDPTYTQYERFYLTASKSFHSNSLVTIYKTKSSYTEESKWQPYRGLDNEREYDRTLIDDDIKGCEYWAVVAYAAPHDYRDVTEGGFSMVCRVTIGRKPDPNHLSGDYSIDIFTGGTWNDYTYETIEHCPRYDGYLIEDQANNIEIASADCFVFHKAYNDKFAFEKKYEFNFSKEDRDNGYDRAIVVISSQEIPDVNIITEEEATRIISIGMDSNGVEIEKQFPERYKFNEETGVWERNLDEDYNHVIDEEKHYGVMTMPTLGGLDDDNERWLYWRLMNETEIQAQGGIEGFNDENHGLNLFQDGEINGGYQTSANDPHGIIRYIYETEDRYDKYSITIYMIPASYQYTNSDGELVKEPNSVFLTTQMYGKSGIYAIYSTWGNNNTVALWRDGHHRKLEVIEYGKYINSITKYESKKITMPYSTIQGAYCVLIVGSYDSTPSLYLHDPTIVETNKTSYLTVSPVNQDNPYVDSKTDNFFATNYDYGDISTEDGSDMHIYGMDKLRTSEYIEFPDTAFYILSSSKVYDTVDGTQVLRKLKAKVYFYDEQKQYKKHIDISDIIDGVSLDKCYDGEFIRVVFMKSDGTNDYDIALNDLVEVMLYKQPMTEYKELVNGYIQVVDDQIVINETPPAPGTDIPSASEYSWDDARVTLVTKTPIKITGSNKKIMVDCNVTSALALPSDVTTTIRVMRYFVKDIVTIVDEQEVHTKTVIPEWHVPDLVPFITIAPNEAVEMYLEFIILYREPEEESDRLLELSRNYLSLTYNIGSEEPKKYQVPNGAIETYGIIVKRVEFDDVNTAQELYNKAMNYLYVKQFDQMQLSVSALDLEILNPNINIDMMSPAEAVRVISWPHSLNRNFSISSMSVTLDDPTSMKFTFGYDNSTSLSKILNRKRKD